MIKCTLWLVEEKYLFYLPKYNFKLQDLTFHNYNCQDFMHIDKTQEKVVNFKSGATFRFKEIQLNPGP